MANYLDKHSSEVKEFQELEGHHGHLLYGRMIYIRNLGHVLVDVLEPTAL